MANKSRRYFMIVKKTPFSLWHLFNCPIIILHATHPFTFSFAFRVPAFDASQYLVSNREFLGFIKANGYEQREYWSDEGWNWNKFRGARHPTFWVCEQGRNSEILSYWLIDWLIDWFVECLLTPQVIVIWASLSETVLLQLPSSMNWCSLTRKKL